MKTRRKTSANFFSENSATPSKGENVIWLAQHFLFLDPSLYNRIVL